MTNREDGYMTTRCTQWQSYDVPTIWSTVSDEGDAVSYMQVTAWIRTGEAIEAHRAALQSALQDLAAGWPPDKSSAAQEFFDRANAILLAMRNYADVASANSSALHGIVNTLNETKKKIEPLFTEWSRRTDAQKSESAVQKLIDKTTFWSNENDWKAELSRRATETMVSSDLAISESRRLIQAPEAFDPPQYALDPTVTGNSSANSLSGGQLANSPSRRHDNLIPPTISPPATTPATTEPVAKLAMVHTQAPLMAQTDQPLGSQLNETPPLTTPSLGIIPSARGTQVGPKTYLSQPDESASIGRPDSVTETSNTIGRNGIIGLPPGSTATSRTSTRNTSQPSTKRLINRTGGTIGSEGAPALRNGGSRTRRGAAGDEILDPDQPWGGAHQGVPGVIAGNNDEHIHAAGPGVIGLDR